MNEDNHLLQWYKNIAANEKKRYPEAVEVSFGAVDEKLSRPCLKIVSRGKEANCFVNKRKSVLLYDK